MQDGIFWTRSDGRLSVRARLGTEHNQLCLAHVEGLGVYRCQHCHRSGVLGGAVDELCVPEHGTDAV